MNETQTTRETVTTQKVNTPPIPTEPPQVAYEKKKTIFRTYQIVWYILGFIEALLAFRFVLLFLAANPRSGFAALIYSLSYPFAFPFIGLFPSAKVGNVVFEWSTLVAFIVYPLLASGIMKLMQFVKPTTPEEVDRNVSTV